MKKFGKIVAVVCAAALTGGVLASCGGGGDKKGNDTIVLAETMEFQQKFDPFFVSAATDQDVVSFTQAGILTLDRAGELVLDGIKGVTRKYNGTDYFYYSPGSLSATTTGTGDSAITTYTIKIRDDIKFSDGKAATIDDVLFGMYATLDTSYTGSATLGQVPIVGLKEYQTNNSMEEVAAYQASMKAVFDKMRPKYIVAEGETPASMDTSDPAYGLTAAEKEIADWAIENAPNTSAFSWVTANSVEDWNANYGTEFATLVEFWAANYGVDLTGVATEDAKWALVNHAIAFDELVGDFYDDYESGLVSLKTSEIAADKTGDEVVKYISGVKRVNDYTMTVEVEGEDNVTYQTQLGGLTISSKDYYGNGTYNYNDANFGFPKGGMYGVVNTKSATPYGAGAYKFVRYADNTVYLTANEHYWDTKAVTGNLQLKYSPSSQIVSGVQAATIDIGDINYNKETVAQIKNINSNGQLNGNKLGVLEQDYQGYGYIGICADNVKVGTDKGSEESKNFRKGYATVMAAYRQMTVDSYYGDSASVIEYPISKTSWACPQPTDSGYQVAYSKDVDGNQIYTASMSNTQRYAAALEAAKGFFKAAGFTYSEATGKFTNVPEIVAMIGGNGQGDHPTFALLDETKKALATIGVELDVRDVKNTNDMWNGLDAGTVGMWVAAWQATPDPDMTQLYRSSSWKKADDYVSGTNYYAIQDTNLDALIDQGKGLTDRAERKAIYKNAMEVVLDWGVEIPVYQRKEATVYSAERIDGTTFVKDMTPQYGWKSEITTVKAK